MVEHVFAGAYISTACVFLIQIHVYMYACNYINVYICSQVMALHVRKQYYNPMFGRDAMDQVFIYMYVDICICIHVYYINEC